MGVHQNSDSNNKTRRGLPPRCWGCFSFRVVKRDVIAHDSVRAFPETVPSTTAGQLELKYRPYLTVEDGCVPYPAVDADGNTSGGLNPTGSPSSGCSNSQGQIYARSATHNGRCAIMFSWYWPKDSPATGLGHRHDWENCVVWLSEGTAAATLLGVAASAHGDYETNTSPGLKGNGPLLRYYSDFLLNHQLGFTSDVGSQQPLIDWESLPPAAQTALENADFGKGIVPFKDATVQDNLAKASLQ